jgi:hypothetical protein
MGGAGLVDNSANTGSGAGYGGTLTFMTEQERFL